MKALIHKTLARIGFSVVRHIDDSLVRNVLRSLRPRDCGKGLVRIGGSADGGYLVPNDLEGIEYCFSPGVGRTATFENHLAGLGIRSFLADYTVDLPPEDHSEYSFDKRFLGSTESDVYFTLPSWKNKYLQDYCGELLLQMDIEGAEYEVVLNTPDELLSQFRIIVIEFHDLGRLFEPFPYRIMEACFRKLLKQFYVVHLHPNNCCGCIRKGDIEIPRVLEATLYNKRRITLDKHATVFPHPLDENNVPTHGPLNLPRCWYS